MNLPALHRDFAKRKHCTWLHGQYNARALHKQFPEYTLDTFYRIRKGVMPKYMPLRVYLTFREFLAYAELKRQQASALCNINLEIKYNISRKKLYEHDRARLGKHTSSA